MKTYMFAKCSSMNLNDMVEQANFIYNKVLNWVTIVINPTLPTQ